MAMFGWVGKKLGLPKRVSAPKAPDARSMGMNQFDANVGANTFNAYQSSGGVSGPGGGMSKSMSFKTMKDPYGRDITVPVQSTEYSLDAPGQTMFDQAGQYGATAGQNLSNYASGPDMYSQVFGANAGDGGLAAIEEKLRGFSDRTLVPRLADQRMAAEEDAANRGITANSAFGDRLQRQLAMSENDARAASDAAAYGVAANQVAQERAQQLGAMQADRQFNTGLVGTGLGARNQLMSGLYSMPNQNYTAGIDPVQQAQIDQQSYQNRYNQFNDERNRSNQTWNTIWNAAGRVGAAAVSSGAGAGSLS